MTDIFAGVLLALLVHDALWCAYRWLAWSGPFYGTLGRKERSRRRLHNLLASHLGWTRVWQA